MKLIVALMLSACLPVTAFCQDITGVWKGSLYNDSTKQTLQYELVVSKDKGKYSALSQTWFVTGDQKFYGIKKINIRIARDGKIVMQDAGFVEHNYPETPDKNIIQLNVLNLVTEGDEQTLAGLFVTNRTREFHDHSGSINVKKVGPLVQVKLLDNFRQAATGANLTVAK